MTFDGVGLTILSIVIAGFAADHFIRSAREAHRARDGESYRTLVMACLVFLASVSFVLGALGIYFWPSLLDVARSFGVVLRGAFIVAVVFVFINRRIDT